MPLFITLAVITGWEWGARTGIISSLYYSSPTYIAQSLVKNVSNGMLLTQTSASLSRMFWGTLIGGVLGLLLGLIMGWSSVVRGLLEPFLAAAHPVPKIAILPLIMVIFGVTDLSLIIVIASGAFFPLLINSMAGVAQIHPIHFEVARNYRASIFKLFQRVVWPATMPLIITGLRLALNTTLLLTVAVEMVSAQSGLGQMIWMAWATMHVEDIYASLLVITLLGILINWLLNTLHRRLVPWQSQN